MVDAEDDGLSDDGLSGNAMAAINTTSSVFANMSTSGLTDDG